MANRSYLCATNTQTIYPSFVEETYNSFNQTVANDVYCIPLLWTALFRPFDIVVRTFHVDGEDVYAEAPLTTRANALANLKSAIPFFNKLFEQEGNLTEYARFLWQAVKAVPHQYITIELHEIAYLQDEQKFYRDFRDLLGSIGGVPDLKVKRAFVDLASFRNLRRFPPADLLLDQRKLDAAQDDDLWNHCRVCGAGMGGSSIGRAAPWEPAD